MTEPLTPIDLDLRDFGFMPLEVVRLRDSDLAALATGDEFRSAVLLWCAAWHQVPAASLPNDDRLLAKFAGFGRDLKGWNAVRLGALRGFVECTDGRLYHPVIADLAIEAGSKKRTQSNRTQKATEARIRKAEEARNAKRGEDRDDDRDGQRNEHQGRGQEKTDKGEDRTGIGQAPLAAIAVADTPTDRKPKRLSRIAADFCLTDDGRKYAADRGWTQSYIDQQLRKFRNYYISEGKTKADWSATWRTWVDNDYDSKRTNSGGRVLHPTPNRADTAIEGMFSDLRLDDMP